MSRETRETIARGPCHHCHGEVAVKLNVSNKAYYTCDHCGFRGQHTWQRSSDAFVAKVKPASAPAPTAAPAGAPIPTPTPTPKPVRSAGTVIG